MALENLSPIVREERLLAGVDLEPATRLEYFLKQAGGSVPTPAAADTGKVLTANNGAVEWKDRNTPDLSIYITEAGSGVYSGQIIGGNFTTVFNKLYTEHIEPFVSCVYFYDNQDKIPLNILKIVAYYDEDDTATLYIAAGIGTFSYNNGAFTYVFEKALTILVTSSTVSVADYD